MKRDWKRSWLLVSVLVISALALPIVLDGNVSKQIKEDTLAGLRPGKDTIERAYRRFGKERVRTSMSGDPGSVEVRESCNHEELTLTLNSSSVIEKATVGSEIGVANVDCTSQSYTRRVRAQFGSGHNLLFRDQCDRIQGIYGSPESKSSFAKGSERLESYVYHFDSTGKSVPLTLEVTCNTAENQVDRITLAVSGISLKP